MYLVSKTFSVPHIYLSSFWYITLTQGAGDAEWTTKTTGAMVKHQIQDQEHTFWLKKVPYLEARGYVLNFSPRAAFNYRMLGTMP